MSASPANTRALIVCDDAKPPASVLRGPWTHQEPIRSRGERPDLNLQLDTLSGQLHGTVSGVAHDLLYIACCCLAADQRVPRGTKQIDVHRRVWRRHFTMVVPVSNPKRWVDPLIQEPLRQALAFATDDDWDFIFVKRPPQLVHQTLFGKVKERSLRGNPECVVLFSGGMDSLCATVEAIADLDQRPVAVSLQSANQVTHVQASLIETLRRRLGWQLPHVGFRTQRLGGAEPDPSQRARAFVLAALGCAVAESLGIETVLLADNGYVSLNPDISGELAGALASRGTHPRLLRLLNDLMVGLLISPVQLLNPLADRTRSEALDVLRRHACEDLLKDTLTCGKFRSPYQSRSVPHCGVCSQCVDRRFAIIQAGLEEVDPVDRYLVDVFREDLVRGEALKIAPMYVRFAQALAHLSPDGIVVHQPKLIDCLDPDTGDVERQALNLAHLLRRHSREVTAVVAMMFGRYQRDLGLGTLPPRSLLRLIAGGTSDLLEVVDSPPVHAHDADTKMPAIAHNGQYWHFTYQNEKAVMRHLVGYERIAQLLRAPGREFDPRLLASGGVGDTVALARAAEAELGDDGSFDEILDADGEEMLRKEISRLRTERPTARAERQQSIDEEIAKIEAHIASARGLGGRHRGSPRNRDRALRTVRKSIQQAIGELRLQLPSLADHLEASITTSGTVSYDPRPLVRWDVAA